VCVILSEAFVVPPTRTRTKLIGNLPLLFLSKKDFVVEKDFSPLEDDQPKDDLLRSSVLQRRVVTALTPASDFLDDISGGWALSYADMRPESENTVLGQVFLATNIAYAIVGYVLSSQGEFLLGFMTELCSIASFSYHFSQLKQPYNRATDSDVKLALLVDYFLAITSIFIGIYYMTIDQALPPLPGLISMFLGIGCLLSCWIWEKGTIRFFFLPFVCCWRSLSFLSLNFSYLLFVVGVKDYRTLYFTVCGIFLVQ